MARVNTLLAMGMLFRTFAETLFYRRIISGLILLILLMVVTGLVVGAVLIGGLYALFYGMVYYGVDREAALLIVGAIVLLMVGGLAWLTMRCLHKMRNILMSGDNTTKVSRVIDSFMEGLHTPAVTIKRS